MSRKSNLVLAAAATIGSAVLSTSAFAFGPPLPGIGGLPHLGPPPGGGLPHLGGLPGGGLPHGRPLTGGARGGPLGGGHIAAGNPGSGLRGVSGSARFSGNTFNNSNYSARAAGGYSGSDNGRWGRYGYYGAAAAGATAGAAAGYAYGDQTYTNGDGCYRSVRYETRTGWHTRVLNACE